MKEELQAKQYYNQIEDEEEFEVEEEEEEVITLDFDKGIAIQEGVIVGEGLLDKVAEQLNKQVEEKEVSAIDAPAPVKEPEKAKPASVTEPTYRDKLSDLFIDTLTSRAIRSLMDAHIKLENEVYDDLQKKHRKMGKAYQIHQNAILKSIDSKTNELRKSYGYTGRVSHEHIPDWSKPYIEDYIKGFINEICNLTGDVN